MAIRLLLFLALLTPVFEPAPDAEIDAMEDCSLCEEL